MQNESSKTQKIRTTSVAIFTKIKESGKNSIRKLADLINRPKSSVHRHLQAQERRDLHPESSLWESPEGYAWLRILVFATLYVFCLGRGVGTDQLSLFFKLIRIDTHVGLSPSALQHLVQQMEALLPQFQDSCEKSVKKANRQVVVGMDETFFGSFLILVLMDLQSGYLLLEDISDDRCYETWHAKTTPRLESLGIEVSYAVSDRAKALIKLALTGFDCDSGADLFHAQQDVSRWLGAKLGNRCKSAQKELEAAQHAENKASSAGTEDERIMLQENRMAAEKTLAANQQSQSDYHDNLQAISDAVHPFSLADSTQNNAVKVEELLEQRAQAFEKIAQQQGIADNRNTMKTFRNQIQPLAVTVSCWWLWVWETLAKLAVDELTQNWLTMTLLPAVYWHHQMNKTQNRKAKAQYRKAWEQAVANFDSHPFTASLSDGEIQHWLALVDSMARQFHRSSSAVEGRNGCLSQMYHNGRGLSKRRLQSATVIHNYGIKREDGTTAAMRLFGTEFPDLFSWLLEHMGELPLPRKGRKRMLPNPLKLISVPA
jgi:hypothetical protein